MNYNDLARVSVRQTHAETFEKLQKGELILPAVYVDGVEVSQGYVDYFSISKAVDAARQAAVSNPRTED